MNILKSKIFKTSFFFLLFSNLGNLFSFFYQISISRYLSLNDYSLIISIYALIAILSVPSGIITFVISYFYNKKKRDYYLKTIIIIFSFIIFLEIILLLIFKKKIYALFKFNDFEYLFFIINIQFFTFIITILNSVLLSKKNYKLFSIFSSLPLYLRYLFLIIAIFIFNNSINLNIIIYINIFSLIVSIFILLKFKKINLFKILTLKTNNYSYFYEVYKIILPFFIIYLSLYYLQNIDIIIIRNLFNEELSGKLAAAIIIGKIPFFALSLMTYLIFPETRNLNNKYNFLLIYNNIFKFIIFFIFASLLYLIFINFIGEKILTLIFGSRFINTGQYMLIISLYYIQLLIYMFLTFIIMANKLFKLYIYSSVLFITTTSTYIFLTNLSIKNIYLTLNLLLFFLNIINIYNVFFSKKKNKK